MIYLDHNATAPLRPAAKTALAEAYESCGNASSVHQAGREARARIEHARDAVARFAACEPSEVVFTSGGSEANALALRGAIGAYFDFYGQVPGTVKPLHGADDVAHRRQHQRIHARHGT